MRYVFTRDQELTITDAEKSVSRSVRVKKGGLFIVTPGSGASFETADGLIERQQHVSAASVEALRHSGAIRLTIPSAIEAALGDSGIVTRVLFGTVIGAGIARAIVHPFDFAWAFAIVFACTAVIDLAVGFVLGLKKIKG